MKALEHNAYSKIPQLRNIIQAVQHITRYRGQDKDDNPVYDITAPLPTLSFTGSVKMHGTNASVTTLLKDGTTWEGSRKKTISAGKSTDNYGFSGWIDKRPGDITNIFNDVWATYGEVEDDEVDGGYITIYGEFIGKGVNSGAGVSQLEKTFVIFEIEINGRTYLPFVSLTEDYESIYNIYDFPTYDIKIDFNFPQDVQNQLVEITKAVELECPVAKYFGVEGIGEGVVYSTEYNGERLRFKVKGQKHSASNVKTMAAICPEKLASINEFVEYAYTENRFNQALVEVFGSTDAANVEGTGPFLKWVSTDVWAEEKDVLEASELTMKDVSRSGQAKAKLFFNNITRVHDGGFRFN